MKILTIKRVSRPNPDGTFGVIFVEDEPPFALTLERSWRDNRRGESCIPVGEYRCIRSVYNAGGYATFEVICPPRELIKFHLGNLDDDSHGCILLGEMFEPVLDKKTNTMTNGVLSSGPAFKEFMSKLKNEDAFTLVIKEC